MYIYICIYRYIYIYIYICIYIYTHIYKNCEQIWSLFWIIPFDCSTGCAGSAGQRHCMAFGERSFSSRMTWAKWLAFHASLTTCSACEMIVLPSSLSQKICWYVMIYYDHDHPPIWINPTFDRGIIWTWHWLEIPPPLRASILGASVAFVKILFPRSVLFRLILAIPWTFDL